MRLLLSDGIKKIIHQGFGSQLRRNMSSGLIRAFINVAVLAVSYPIYLHYLGYEKFGVWLVLTTVLSFAQMGNPGIAYAVTKLVAEEHGRGDVEGIQKYVSMALTVLSVCGIVVMLAILGFKDQIIAAFGLTEQNRQTATWLLPYIGLLSVYVFLVQALNSTVMGLGRMDLANYIQLAGRMVAVVVAVVMLAAGRGIESLLIGNTLSYVVIHLGSVFFIRTVVRLRFFSRKNWDRTRLKTLFQFGGGIMGGTILSMLIAPFNKLMLSRYAGVETVPIFEIAYQGAFQIRSLLESALRAIMPEISRLYGIGTAAAFNSIKAVNRRAVKLLFIGALPIYAVLFLSAGVILKLWLRDRFQLSLPSAFRIMLICTFLSLVAVPAFHILTGLGKIRYCFFTSFILSVVNIGMVAVFWLVNSKVTVNSIGYGLIVAFAVSSLYTIYKCRRIMHSQLKLVGGSLEITMQS